MLRIYGTDEKRFVKPNENSYIMGFIYYTYRNK